MTITVGVSPVCCSCEPLITFSASVRHHISCQQLADGSHFPPFLIEPKFLSHWSCTNTNMTLCAVLCAYLSSQVMDKYAVNSLFTIQE